MKLQISGHALFFPPDWNWCFKSPHAIGTLCEIKKSQSKIWGVVLVHKHSQLHFLSVNINKTKEGNPIDEPRFSIVICRNKTKQVVDTAVMIRTVLAKKRSLITFSKFDQFRSTINMLIQWNKNKFKNNWKFDKHELLILLNFCISRFSSFLSELQWCLFFRFFIIV